MEIRRDEREERAERAHEWFELWRERGGSWMPGEEELSTVYTVSRTDGLDSDRLRFASRVRPDIFLPPFPSLSCVMMLVTLGSNSETVPSAPLGSGGGGDSPGVLDANVRYHIQI